VGALAVLGFAALIGPSCSLPQSQSGAEETTAGELEHTGLAPLIPPGATIVTLTFADTLDTQTKAGPMLARYGMRATFFLSSGRIGTGGHLTLAQVRELAAAGHEVGSHTIDHVDLETVSLAEARHQICDDRVNLMLLGFPITSFAYPFGSDTPAIRQLVIDCNFNNARATGGLRNPYGCSSCPPAESLPPVDVFSIRTPPSIQSTWTLADMQSLVTQAENAGGGWVTISLHDICDVCDTYGVREQLLDSFLAWLAPRTSRGTYVMTMDDVIDGALTQVYRTRAGMRACPMRAWMRARMQARTRVCRMGGR
jgi:peptidoglycan/xylan/chitin deacetylase (PgdA/CDA1 family)